MPDLGQIIRELFPYLCLFYLVDSIIWNSGAKVAFVSRLGMTFAFKTDPTLASPLPTSQVILGQLAPIFGVKAAYLPQRSRRWRDAYHENVFTRLDYDDIKGLETDGGRIKVNGKRMLDTPSGAWATRAAELLGRLRSVEAEEREGVLADSLCREFDVRHLRMRRVALERAMAIPSGVSGVSFALLFGLMPLAAYTRLGHYLSLERALVFLGLLALANVVAGYFSHRKLYPADKEGRALFVFTLLCYPLSGAHVVSHLTRDAFAEYDWVTIAAEILPRNDFLAVARVEWAKLEAACNGLEGEFSEALLRRQQAIAALFDTLGIGRTYLEPPAKRRDSGAASYCPVCSVEYMTGFTVCGDCGVTLRFFDSAQGKERKKNN